jgi:hypothetical protein
MGRFESISVITTPGCNQCAILLKDLIPLAHKYNLQISHMVAKEVVRITNKGMIGTGDIRLYKDGSFYAAFPEHLPKEFPILIYGQRYTMVGGDSCKALKYILEADAGNQKSIEQLIDEGHTNIDQVIKDYESTPGTSSIYKNTLL